MRVLSWDCANRTLAWSDVTIDTRVFVKLDGIAARLRGWYERAKIAAGCTQDVPAVMYVLQHSPEHVEDLRKIIYDAEQIIAGFLVYHSNGVADVVATKLCETTLPSRSRSLRNWLQESPVSVEKLLADGASMEVLVELQPIKIGPKTNTGSTVVSHQLAFYYADYTVNMVDPKLKNMFCVAPGMDLDTYKVAALARRKKRSDALYIARKRHSKDTFLWLITALGLHHIVKNIPKAVLDDLADSTMQVIGWLRSNRMFE